MAAETDSAKPLIIAIDGPSGAGKGTIARELAARLNYRHVDTGAMYRAVAWKALDERLDLQDESAIAALSERARFDLEGGRVIIDGSDVAQAIRTPEIDAAATTVARHPAVRRALVARQRDIGRAGGVVMEGRDIGTVVFPGADVKIYLDASPEERARRRALDPAHSGGPTAVAEVATALTARDELDRTRTASPLYAAPDARIIDTTGKPVTQVVEEVLRVVEEKKGLGTTGPQPPVPSP
jgi:CMP/dCMP kinase